MNNAFPDQQHGVLVPLTYIAQTSVSADICATEGSDPHDLQQRIQNGFETIRTALEFSSKSGDHRSDVQRPALTIKVDTLRIFFVFQRS